MFNQFYGGYVVQLDVVVWESKGLGVDIVGLNELQALCQLRIDLLQVLQVAFLVQNHLHKHWRKVDRQRQVLDQAEGHKFPQHHKVQCVVRDEFCQRGWVQTVIVILEQSIVGIRNLLNKYIEELAGQSSCIVAFLVVKINFEGIMQ